MSDETDNLVLEHLRHIRGRVDQISDDMGDVKQRLSALERGQAKMLHEHADIYDDQARQQSVIDRLAARIDRIERRLELSD